MGSNRSKIVALGAVVSLALVTAGCATGTPADSGPKTLTILTQWTDGSAEYSILSDVAASLKDQGVTVKLQPTSGDIIQTSFETSTLSGDEADIVVVPLVDKDTDWLSKGLTVDASTFIADAGISVKPDATAFFTNDTGLQAIPYSGYSWPVWYNMDLLKSAGVDKVPATTDELLAAVTKLKAAGIAPMVVGGSDWSGQKLFEQIVQGYLSDDEAAKVLSTGNWCATPNAMKGIDLFVKLRDAGLFVDGVAGYSADQMTAAYYGKEAAIMSAGSWSFAPTPADIMASTTLAGLPIPAGSPHKTPSDYQGWNGAFFISQNGGKNKAAVDAFVKAIFDPAIVARFAGEANFLPAVDVPADAKITQPLMAQAVALGDSVTSLIIPDNLVPGAVAQPMTRVTALAYSAGQDDKAICSALDDAYKQ